MPVRFAGDDVTLTTDVEGAWSGPAVLLVHGGGQTAVLGRHRPCHRGSVG